MVDNNAKAPKVRSGDEINPVVAKIVKITAALVFVALIVVITLVTIELIKRNKKNKTIFEDKVAITLSDYKIITKGDNYDDIFNDEVRKIALSNETGIFYFYFYYGTLENKINKDQVNLIKDIADDATIFYVNLEADKVAEDAENPEETFKQYLENDSNLLPSGNTLDIRLTLRNPDEYPSFIIVFTEKDFVEEDENQFLIFRSNKNIIEKLESLPKKETDK